MAQSSSALKSGPAKEKPTAGRFLSEEFPLVRKAMFTLGASLLIGAALVGASQIALHQSRDAMNQALLQRNLAAGKNAQAETEKREALDYQAKYIRLRDQGFIGEENRLDWTEQIKILRDQLRLLPISYEISAQQPVAIEAEGVSTGDFVLRSSKMTLKMELLHEMDLLNFLGELRHKGRYTVQSCVVERSRATTNAPLSPRLAAECELFLLTLGEPAAPPAAEQ